MAKIQILFSCLKVWGGYVPSRVGVSSLLPSIFNIAGPFGFGCSVPTCPSFPWFFCLPRKNLKLTKDFCPLPNPLKPWKSRENAQITKEIPCLKLTKEFQKTKERKDRAVV